MPSELTNVSQFAQAPPSQTFFVVPDTNILLHHFDILSAFADDVEKLNLNVAIIIPRAVVNELDWQKKHNWFSRKASLWIWKKLQQKTILKGQSSDDVSNNPDRFRNNDEKIIECALVFAQKGKTVLCSADRNLCSLAVSEGVDSLDVMNPHDDSPWSSRVLGTRLFGPENESKFSGWRPVYTEDSRVVVDPKRQDDDMDVDNPAELEGQLYQTDARDSLHRQVVEVFLGLLKVLIASDQQERSIWSRDGASASMHAPSVPSSMHALRLDLSAAKMSITEILDYVQSRCPKGPFTLPRDSPPLNSFLSNPYVSSSGGRKGSEWSRQAWLISLRRLQTIGEKWGDRGEDIVKTIQYDLISHLQIVFRDKKLLI
ncbi:hypothetical protein D9757_002688 [Collybiopsis confluens]|uniref:PIN domain-containing protein n=1 Tax=Collybiopsis confluens TaxID=2823264 RepID=A0A8H5MDS4_9AGAR|nr:hypothetical protein D9757_002688 [Collybiopsis confluens]